MQNGKSKGKSIRYFCNLEKRLYLAKYYSNLILDNGIGTSDQNGIQSELQLFYKTLYSSTEPIINESHVDLFCNSKRPGISSSSSLSIIYKSNALTYIRNFQKHFVFH